MAVQIIIDSTTNYAEGLKGQFIEIPMKVMFGNEEYLDGVNLSKTEFYEKLIESDVLPKTSQATPYDYDQVFSKIKEDGDTAVVIALSSKLSGTYQSAVMASEDYEDIIYVVDSFNVTVGAGVLLEYAIRLRDKGLSAKEIADELDEKKKKVRLVAVLDTLEYLKKGGRVSAAAAFAGGLLSIKPVVAVIDGEVEVLGKARGSKQGNNYLVQEIEKTGGVDFDMPLLLGYTGLSDHLLQKYVEDSREMWVNGTDSLNSTIVGSVIGTHVGPGAIAVSFFCK